MENGNVSQVSVIPDKNEARAIQKNYTKLALVLLVFVVLFRFVSELLIVGVALYSGASGSFSQLSEAGTKIIYGNGVTRVIFGMGFPVVSEIIAIIIAYFILGISIRTRVKTDGFDIKTINRGFWIEMMTSTVCAMIGAIVLVFLKVNVTEVHGTANSLGAYGTSAVSKILSYSYICIIGPIVEECLFRVVIIDTLSKYNERFALIMSSLIFALMHGTMFQAANAFFGGIIFGVVYLRSRSVIPSAVLHILANSFAALSAVIMGASTPDVNAVLAGDMSSVDMRGFVFVMLLAVLRFIAVPVGIVFLILELIKGIGVKKPNEAGKKRSTALFFKNPLCIIVLVIFIGIVIYNGI